jgi:sugar/nucleoside kinase (ribokinase family)
VGDLLEDVVVAGLPAPTGDPGCLAVNVGSDTPAVIDRRLGGSGANVAAVAARLGAAVRFIGQVGDDDAGRYLVGRLAQLGVDAVVRQAGVTGTVVVLLHPDGERSMLTHRGAAALLGDPDPAWLDGLSALHLPLYSLQAGPLAESAVALAHWARQRGLLVSLDLSSTTLLRQFGPRLGSTIRGIRPAITLANQTEAAVVADELGIGLGHLADRAVVVKRGPLPALIVTQAGSIEVPASSIGPVADTTGAGDAFAAGVLAALIEGADLAPAVRAGHQAAALHLSRDAGGSACLRGGC